VWSQFEQPGQSGHTSFKHLERWRCQCQPRHWLALAAAQTLECMGSGMIPLVSHVLASIPTPSGHIARRGQEAQSPSRVLIGWPLSPIHTLSTLNGLRQKATSGELATTNAKAPAAIHSAGVVGEVPGDRQAEGRAEESQAWRLSLELEQLLTVGGPPRTVQDIEGCTG
jgi:hypothetical protein